MKQHENILIAGCGYVGTALAQRLVNDGHHVWGLRRNTSALPGGVHPFTADLQACETLRNQPAAFDVVVFTASSGGFNDDAYRAAYVDAPRNLLEALAAAGQAPRRVLFTSSTGVYHQNDGGWHDETAPLTPGRFSGKRLLEGEAVFHQAPFPAVVVRLGGIYGPGRTRLIDQVRQGRAHCVAGETKYLNIIHRDDCAGVLRHLMHVPEAKACYLAVDNEPVEKCTLLRWTASALGLPEPPRLPPEEAEVSPRGGNRRLSNARLRATGYTFAYPNFREGYRPLL